MVVEWYKDGLGNLLSGVQWDGAQATADLIKSFSNNRAQLDKRGVMGLQSGYHRINVGVGDWVCISADRTIFPMTNQQMTSSYTAATAPPQRAADVAKSN